MKTCPTCQASYPDGFRYCPNDSDTLVNSEEYARRSKPPAPVTTPSVAETGSPVGRDVIARESKPETPPVSPRVADESRKPQPATVSTPGHSSHNIVNQPPTSFETQARPTAQPTTQTTAPRAETPAAEPFVLPAAPASSNGVAGHEFGGLSLALPESGGLISRLISSVQQFVRDFGKPKPKIVEGAAGSEFLLPDEPFITRFKREFQTNWEDFRRDPRTFIREVWRGEGSNPRRRRMLLTGAAIGVSVQALIIILSLVFIRWTSTLKIKIVDCSNAPVSSVKVKLRDLIKGTSYELATNQVGEAFFNKLTPSNYAVEVDATDTDKRERRFTLQRGVDETADFTVCSITTMDLPKVDTAMAKVPKEVPQGKGGFTGGSKPKVEQAGGGGGGGRNQPTPPSKGTPPQMSMVPQVMPPNPEPPKIKDPKLVVPTTTLGDPMLSKHMPGPDGLLDAPPAPPSSGPGSGAGIGTGKGTGAGSGEGAGQGPGRGLNKGGGDPHMGGGPGTDGSGGVYPAGPGMRPIITYKEKAKYTEEARQNKVQGAVVLSAIFTADGRITGIKVIRGLPDGLTEKAIEAAQRIKFQPAMKNGVPVSVRMTLEFNFAVY